MIFRLIGLLGSYMTGLKYRASVYRHWNHR